MGPAPAVLTLLALVLAGRPVAAQQPAASQTPASRTVAFADVHVVSTESDRIAYHQTVVTRGDRIVTVGPYGGTPIPDDALVVEGRERYLTPGLTDAHVHLTTDMPWAPVRPHFGDGPLYLLYGVTTVVNLRGAPEQLEWRRRIEAGELVGPTIYTAGEFINEPRVRTEHDVTREVEAQRRAGYDLVKFHEVWTSERGFITTVGLSPTVYRRLNDAARESGLPLVGHAPINLGLDALLEARQPLAHLGALSNVYFLPMNASRGWVITTLVAFVVLASVTTLVMIQTAARSWRGGRSIRLVVPRVRTVATGVTLAFAVTGVVAALFLPGGPRYDSVVLRIAFTILIGSMIGPAVWLLWAAVRMLRAPERSLATAIELAAIAGATIALLTAGLLFWIPVAWRSHDDGIDHLAVRLRDASIPVQTTLVAYDALGGRGRRALAGDPAIQYLRPETQELWRHLPRGAPNSYRYTAFMQKVAGRLHRAGVPLVAATDALGLALVTPGSSLHRELQLLTESGLTVHEALRAATVAPAAWLRRQNEFGTIAPGQRADLLLVDGNPLERIERLRQPDGVMARGRWFTREQLASMLPTEP